MVLSCQFYSQLSCFPLLCRLLHNHIEKLSKVVTANHKNLRIPEKYQRELPWPAAQAEILNINVYKVTNEVVKILFM